MKKEGVKNYVPVKNQELDRTEWDHTENMVLAIQLRNSE